MVQARGSHGTPEGPKGGHPAWEKKARHVLSPEPREVTGRLSWGGGCCLYRGNRGRVEEAESRERSGALCKGPCLRL